MQVGLSQKVLLKRDRPCSSSWCFVETIVLVANADASRVFGQTDVTSSQVIPKASDYSAVPKQLTTQLVGVLFSLSGDS